jgi:hypothetical protein
MKPLPSDWGSSSYFSEPCSCGHSRSDSNNTQPINFSRRGFVEFRLIYDGDLKGASKTNTRSEHKHEIRRQFESP